uniref:Acireductone dioxygenase n=1 Tax=Helicotheca tamesis TaxID=374047 RepID=A0A7S2IBX5_9STRA|mmetsp:Transcript_7799/g.10661  ORF Transcript_7799/g.10661 Transcript_7799/m.10661 type:complete len:230 (+) Transcript_7799:26-715(+)
MADTASGAKLPEPKKLKTSEEEKEKMDQAPDNEWPDAWIMTDGECKDQKAENRKEPNEVVDAAALRKLGICYWKMDAGAYDYPALAVPWDPKDAVDPRLKQLRDERGYSYADIITIHPEKLPEYDKKVKSFFEEHIHDAEEIRYILDGSGFFDVRDDKDRWVRIHVKKGDLMTLPEGIYHRFTVDENDIIKAMRLFIGQPIWTPFNRPQEEHPSRKKYVTEFIEEKKEE